MSRHRKGSTGTRVRFTQLLRHVFAPAPSLHRSRNSIVRASGVRACINLAARCLLHHISQPTRPVSGFTCLSAQAGNAARISHDYLTPSLTLKLQRSSSPPTWTTTLTISSVRSTPSKTLSSPTKRSQICFHHELGHTGTHYNRRNSASGNWTA